MKINFETLFNEVGRAALVNNVSGEADVVGTVRQYANELIDLVSRAKRDGISGYALVETALVVQGGQVLSDAQLPVETRSDAPETSGNAVVVSAEGKVVEVTGDGSGLALPPIEGETSPLLKSADKLNKIRRMENRKDV